MSKRLPSKLGVEPLIEATCELRVKARVPLHTVLPGYLIAKLDDDDVGDPEQLPAMQIPHLVRAHEPNLANAHLMRLEWRGHHVNFGDAGIALTSRHPYPGWIEFKRDVIFLFDTILTSDFVEGIERYSAKYTNLFDGQGGVRPSDAFDWSLSVGEFHVSDENCQLRVEIGSEEFLTVVMIATSAMINHVKLGQRAGAIVDVDVLCRHATNDVATFKSELAWRLDAVKQHNKTTFFNVLKDGTIAALKPSYD